MRKIYNIVLLAFAFLLAGCEEFGPVFTGDYGNPEKEELAVLVPTHTIAELAAMYEIEKPVEIKDDIVICGKVSTNDQPGNFYKSFYIQDETGGIEIKVGRNGLYNEYKPGQTVYIKCKGLTLGMYGYKSGYGNGMVQLGYTKDPQEKYETSYIELPILVDRHIIKGEHGDPVEPEVIEESDLPRTTDTQAKNRNVGRLVTLKGLTYANETFTLLYLDSNKDKEAAFNRAFLSDETWGITTWAMSEQLMREYLYSGIWDECLIGSGNDQSYGSIGDHRVEDEVTGKVTYPDIEKAPYSVSQYFKLGKKEIQIRTSGYCKFSDLEIDPAVLSGDATIDATGILTMYQGNIQFTLIDANGITVNK